MSQNSGSGARMSRASADDSTQFAHGELMNNANPAVAVIAYLLAGPLTFGLIGWGLDRWIGTGFVFLLVGVLFGMGLAFYVIWLRYGVGDA